MSGHHCQTKSASSVSSVVQSELCGRNQRGVVKVVNDGLDEILSTPQVAQMVEEREQARALEKPDQTTEDWEPESVPE